MRAILGQQVTVVAARKLAGQLAASCGTPLPPEGLGEPELRLAFPSAADVVNGDLTVLGMPRARKDALLAIARAALEHSDLFEPRETIEETVTRLLRIPGVGDWTAHYIALRASREPDAFPASDVGLLRGATNGDGVRPTPRELLARAERWRPWRGYAAQHLWASDARPPSK